MPRGKGGARNINCQQQPFLEKEERNRYLCKITVTKAHKTPKAKTIHIYSGFYFSLWQNVTLGKDVEPHK